jgi:ferredoxin
MHVEADREVCIGSGNCLLNAPTVFDQDEKEALVVVLQPEPPAEVHNLVRRAAHLCPSAAISITE